MTHIYDAEGKLPKLDHLHELVQLAVDDARSLPVGKYRPEAGEWHKPHSHEEECFVCLAGATMAMGLQSPISYHLIPSSFKRRTRAYLWALEKVRGGNYGPAAKMFYGANRLKRLRVEHFHDLGLEVSEKTPLIRYMDFTGWNEFNVFLRDLETRVIPALKEAGL